jgi:hypothetical protein
VSVIEDRIALDLPCTSEFDPERYCIGAQGGGPWLLALADEVID